MDRYQYLILLGLCLLITLPLEFVFKARVWRRPRRLLHSLWPPALVFGVWDAWATEVGHWSFNPRYTTGWKLPFDLPVEELVFFVAVPICGLLTFEAVRNLLDGKVKVRR
jgi:lycopene cyclase domain-containing protein